MADVLAVDAGALDEQRLSKFKSPKVDKEDDLKYDLGNLLASDIHPIDMAEFRRDPEFLMKLTRDNVQLLFNKLFELPTEKVEGITLAMLPNPTTPIPRGKPIPKERKQTKWEKFADARGIKKKAKRERMIWDESTGKWRPRWGKDRGNNNEEQWVLPAKASDDPASDPFLKMKQDKKKRVEKNKLNQLRNIRAETKGTAPLNAVVASGQTESREKLKTDLEAALQVARKSSASLGKFDTKLPEEKKLSQGKRKYDPLVNTQEREKNIKVLDKLLGKETAVLDVKKATNSFISSEQKESKGKKGSWKGGKGGAKGGKSGAGKGGKAGGRKGK